MFLIARSLASSKLMYLLFIVGAVSCVYVESLLGPGGYYDAGDCLRTAGTHRLMGVGNGGSCCCRYILIWLSLYSAGVVDVILKGTSRLTKSYCKTSLSLGG
jgi:hypothetical protein